MSTTIIVSPLGRQEENTGEVVKLDIFAKDQVLFSTYDKIEVWRSTTEQCGPYNELTAMSLTPARLPLGAEDPPVIPLAGPSAVLNGLVLKLLVNESDELVVTFSGVDPITYGVAAAQVLSQTMGAVEAYVTPIGEFVVQTAGAGPGSTLRVLSSDGAAQLELPVDQLAFGREARLNLCSGTVRYQFEDRFGSESYFYKIRFRNASDGAVSEFSLPHSIGARAGTNPSNLIYGIADVIQGNGKPLINQPVQLYTEFTGLLVDGKVMVGTTLCKLTDVNGHVEFVLVRGQKFTVSVPGTSLYRTITVPTDPAKEVFNLFDPDIADADIFKVQVPEIIVAERRSL